MNRSPFPSAFLDAIDRAVMDRRGKKQGDNLVFQCPLPGHDDKTPSASWNRTKAVWRCHRCHDETEKGRHLGALALADLLGVEKPEREQPKVKAGPRRIVAVYDYTRDGELLFQAVRYEPKGFGQRRPDPDRPGEFIWNLQGVEPVLYRLESLESADPRAWVYLCAGEKDADRLRSLGRVATTNPMGEGKWRDSYTQALAGRNVAILVDNDDKGRKHGATVAPLLAAACPEVKVLDLPGLLPKGDVSDWLDAGHSAEDLDAFCESAPPWSGDDAVPDGPPYSDGTFAIHQNVHHQYIEPKMTRDGEMVGGGWKPLANFTAYVVGDASFPEDDTLNYSEVMLQDSNGRTYGPKRVDASIFRRPDDWLSLWGSWPRVFPGVSRSILLNAIQSASGTAPTITVYDRTGWTSDWRFLSASGAMTLEGLDTSVRVEPGGRLNGIALQEPSDAASVEASVRLIIDLASEIAQTEAGTIATQAMLAAAFRAPLIPAKRANFTMTLMGVTGSVKSGLAGLAASLYGPAFNYDHLHGSWQSTLNSLVDLISRPRHTMIVIDDYLEKEAGNGIAGRRAVDRDTLIRHQGNGSTRSRLRADATRNDGVDPSVILVSTQETLGSYLDESEIGRQLIIPMQKGDLSIEKVKHQARTNGRTGVYNLGFSAYIQYLCQHMPRIVTEVETVHAEIERTRLADLATRSGRRLHERTRPAAADLLVGWHYFLEFALAIGAIDEDEHSTVSTAMESSIAGLMLLQDQFQANEAPERVFIELLQEAVHSKHACLASRTNNDAPGNARMLGWTPVARETRDDIWTEFRPAPHRIGWVDDENVYLSVAATAKALQGMAASARKNVPLGERSIGPHLARHGISLPGHGGRPTQTIKIGESSEGGGTTARALVIPRRMVFPDIDLDTSRTADPIDLSTRKGHAA